MAAVSLSRGLRAEYIRLFATCLVRPEHIGDVARIAKKVFAFKPRYDGIAHDLQVPWFFIALVHRMESGNDFDCHFHNGDPLTARTVHVPYGRPIDGEPPFTWEQSTIDALQFHRIPLWHDWNIAGTLYRLEAWNGFGYRIYHPYVLSPYLWGFSNHYMSGKYGVDGIWDDSLVSQQCGAATILKRWVNAGHVTFAEPEVPG